MTTGLKVVDTRRVSLHCSSQVCECRAFPTAAAKSQSQKLTLLPPIPQTLLLLQSRSAPKSVSVYGSSILLVMGAPQSFAASPCLPDRARRRASKTDPRKEGGGRRGV